MRPKLSPLVLPSHTVRPVTYFPLAPALCPVLLILCLLLAACDKPAPKPAAQAPAPVLAQRPEVQNIPLLLESTGTTQAVRSAELMARVEGTLQKVAYEDGALVKEGATLFVIDPNVYAARLQQAEANLTAQKSVRNRASIEYARAQRLYAQRAVSQATLVSWREQLGNAEAEVAAAEAALAQARIELDYAVIKAPFTGRVTRHKADVGNIVGPQTGALATVIAEDPLYAAFTAPAAQVLPLLRSFDEGKPIAVELRLTDGGEKAFLHKGVVDYISPEVDPSSGTLALRAVFANADGALLPGLLVRVRLSTGQLHAVPVIPRQAVMQSQGTSFVYSIDAEGKARMLPVSTGPQVEAAPETAGAASQQGTKPEQSAGQDKIAIVDGITPDTMVIYDGMAKIRPGQAVINKAQQP